MTVAARADDHGASDGNGAGDESKAGDDKKEALKKRSADTMSSDESKDESEGDAETPVFVPRALEERPPLEWDAFAAAGGKGKRVFVVPIEGTIDLGLAPFVERVAREAGKNDVVLLRVKTFGGRVDAAVRIRDALLQSEAKTVAFVEQRAISAGALISLATDTLLMAPGASIGAATPVQQGQGGEMKATSEKVVSYMRAEMRATAEAKKRPAKLAEAMVDADIAVQELAPKGKLLTMTTKQAVRYGIADGAVSSVEDATKKLNLASAKRLERDTHWAERLSRVLTDPTVSSLLMTFGTLGILMSLYTGGFGIGAIIGLACLALFFLGQYMAHLAGFEELILLGLGIVLVALEVFVVPGFGIVGVAGGLAIATAMILSMWDMPIPLDVSFELGYAQAMLQTMLVRLAVVAVLLVIAAFLFARLLPRSRATKWLVFRAPSDAPGAEASGGALPESYGHLAGKKGVTLSVLRPSGTVLIDGEKVHCMTDGTFLPKGAQVEVTAVQGNRIEVRESHQS